MKTTFRPSQRGSTAFSGVNLLIVLAVALCGLIAWQWKRETNLFTENQTLQSTVQKDHETKDQLQKHIENLQSEINRIESERKKDAELHRTNAAKINDLARQLSKAEAEAHSNSNTVTFYRSAFERATNQLSIANTNISKANDVINSMKKAVEDRNEIAVRLNELNKKYGELMTERNDIVEKFNSFVKEVEAAQKKEKK